MMGANGGTVPDARPGWQWDVALSFAGAQRDYVEQVAAALKARGVRCFYDADEQIDLWGKYLAEELPAIYGEQATAVVMFVSAEYAAREWTRVERRTALARAVRERQEYVLPARFDDTPLPGLPSDMVAVDLRTRSPQQFAAVIADKLAALAAVPGTHDESAPVLLVERADSDLKMNLVAARQNERGAEHQFLDARAADPVARRERQLDERRARQRHCAEHGMIGQPPMNAQRQTTGQHDAAIRQVHVRAEQWVVGVGESRGGDVGGGRREPVVVALEGIGGQLDVAR